MDYKVILSDFFIADLEEIVEYLKARVARKSPSASAMSWSVVLDVGRNPLHRTASPWNAPGRARFYDIRIGFITT